MSPQRFCERIVATRPDTLVIPHPPSTPPFCAAVFGASGNFAVTRFITPSGENWREYGRSTR